MVFSLSERQVPISQVAGWKRFGIGLTTKQPLLGLGGVAWQGNDECSSIVKTLHEVVARSAPAAKPCPDPRSTRLHSFAKARTLAIQLLGVSSNPGRLNSIGHLRESIDVMHPVTWEVSRSSRDWIRTTRAPHCHEKSQPSFHPV